MLFRSGLETSMVGKSADFVVEAIGTEVGTLGKCLVGPHRNLGSLVRGPESPEGFPLGQFQAAYTQILMKASHRHTHTHTTHTYIQAAGLGLVIISRCSD